MKNYSIGIFGLGNIGLRHLEGILKSKKNLEISCFDPSQKAWKKAESIFFDHNLGKKTIKFYETIQMSEKKFDLVIISTNSDIRFKVLQDIFDHSYAQYVILEKVLFQNIKDLKKARRIIEKHKSSAWVNCPRRKWDSYKEVKEILFDKEVLNFTLEGGKWGMSSNAIHFLDLFEWLSSSKIDSIDISKLDSKIMKSKREGYVELSGIISGELKNSFKFKLISDISEENLPPKLRIFGNDINILISETNNHISIKKNDGNEEKKFFEICFQSDLSGIILDEILSDGDSELTNFEDSYFQHEILLNSFTEHISKVTKKNIENCPIT